jgi:hypothetical protein
MNSKFCKHPECGNHMIDCYDKLNCGQCPENLKMIRNPEWWMDARYINGD